jgi:hypothetical protein
MANQKTSMKKILLLLCITMLTQLATGQYNGSGLYIGFGYAGNSVLNAEAQKFSNYIGGIAMDASFAPQSRLLKKRLELGGSFSFGEIHHVDVTKRILFPDDTRAVFDISNVASSYTATGWARWYFSKTRTLQPYVQVGYGVFSTSNYLSFENTTDPNDDPNDDCDVIEIIDLDKTSRGFMQAAAGLRFDAGTSRPKGRKVDAFTIDLTVGYQSIRSAVLPDAKQMKHDGDLSHLQHHLHDSPPEKLLIAEFENRRTGARHTHVVGFRNRSPLDLLNFQLMVRFNVLHPVYKDLD